MRSILLVSMLLCRKQNSSNTIYIEDALAEFIMEYMNRNKATVVNDHLSLFKVKILFIMT